MPLLTSVVPLAFVFERLLSRHIASQLTMLMGRCLIGCSRWQAPPAPPPARIWWGTLRQGLVFRWWPNGMEGRGWFLKNYFVNRGLGVIYEGVTNEEYFREVITSKPFGGSGFLYCKPYGGKRNTYLCIMAQGYRETWKHVFHILEPWREIKAFSLTLEGGI